MGDPSYDDRMTIKIIAMDENDNPPEFPRLPNTVPYTLEVMEENSGVIVGMVDVAEDPDTGNNSLICYYIVG